MASAQPISVVERRAPALLPWLLALLLTVGAAATLVRAPLALAAGVLALALAVVVTVAFAQPRWVLVLELGLVVAYVPGAVRASTGAYTTDQVLVYLLLAVVVARWLIAFEHIRLPRANLLFVALGAVMAVSLLFAGDRVQGLSALKEYATGAVLVLLMLALLDSAAWLRRALWAFALAASALAFVALVQQATGTFDSDYLGFAQILEDRSLRRAAGPLDPNFFAQVLVAASALLVYLWLGATRRLERVAAPVLLAFCLLAIGATYSRGGWLALLVVVVLVLVLRRARLWIPVAGLAVLAVAAAFFLPSDARDRLTDVVSPGEEGIAYASDTSVANRFAENLVAWHMFVEHPVLGVGPGNYPDRYFDYAQALGLEHRVVGSVEAEQRPHSLYLETLAELGVAGAAALLVLLGAAFRGAWRARTLLGPRDGLLAEATLVALAGFLTCSLFLHPAYPRYLWITVGLALVAGSLAPGPTGRGRP